MTLRKNDQELVTIYELSRLIGLSEGAIRGRISTGFWVEGKHYFREGRRIMMDRNACNQRWMEK